MRKSKFKCLKCGQCCGVVPIPVNKYMKHLDDIQTIPEKCIQDKKYIIAITHDLRCIFLTDNNLCAIYNDRPEICRRFGNDIKIPRPNVKWNGTLRTDAEREKILESIDVGIKKLKERVINE